MADRPISIFRLARLAQAPTTIKRRRRAGEAPRKPAAPLSGDALLLAGDGYVRRMNGGKLLLRGA